MSINHINSNCNYICILYIHLSLSLSLSLYIYIYIYNNQNNIYIYIYIHIHLAPTCGGGPRPAGADALSPALGRAIVSVSSTSTITIISAMIIMISVIVIMIITTTNIITTITITAPPTAEGEIRSTVFHFAKREVGVPKKASPQAKCSLTFLYSYSTCYHVFVFVLIGLVYFVMFLYSSELLSSSLFSRRPWTNIEKRGLSAVANYIVQGLPGEQASAERSKQSPQKRT